MALARLPGGLCVVATVITLFSSCSTPEQEMSPSEWIRANSTVLDQLRSYDAVERRQGVSRIKRLGKEQGAALTYFILSDPKLEDYRLEVVLARLLADWKDPRAIPFLLRGLQVPDEGAVRIASEGLLAFGNNPNVVDTLSEMLKAETPRDREIAANILAKIGSSETVDLLGSRIKTELDPEVRAQIVMAVIQGKHHRRKEFLVDALTDADPAIRELAWSALKKYSDLPDVNYSPRSSDVERARAVGVLRIWVGKGKETGQEAKGLKG